MAVLMRMGTDNRHLHEINRDNPLGMGGQIADEYAGLIQQLWSGRHSAVAPRDFKACTKKKHCCFAFIPGPEHLRHSSTAQAGRVCTTVQWVPAARLTGAIGAGPWLASVHVFFLVLWQCSRKKHTWFFSTFTHV